MNCPVCKYPNTAGATHCGMCYEVFNRSAAQTYLHAVKKERRQNEEVPEESPAIIKSEKIVEEAKAIVEQIDWKGLADQATYFLKKIRLPLLAVGGLIGLWILASFLFSASLWYHLFGRKFEYVFPDREQAQYMVGLSQSIKSWSERHGRLDTPLEEFTSEEIGNTLFERKKGASKNRPAFVLRAREWIQVLHDANGSASHTLSLKHPSLANVSIVLDKNGRVLERRYALGPRLAKSLYFLTPKFPSGRLSRGQTWDEPVEWLDVYNDWRIYWSGTLHWTLGDLEDCDAGTCAQLTYQAELSPKLAGAPSWAGHGVREVSGQASTEGSALFNISHERLLSNTFSYDGILYLPIDNLFRIPWELRIGRGVKGPGQIAIRFQNKIDIHKN